MKDYLFTAFVISSGGFVLVTELEQTNPLYALIVGLVCLVYSVDCVVSAVKEFKKPKLTLGSSIQLRPYKIPPNVIKHYDEAYPYLVVAEMPNSTEVEYWWVGTACDIEHSCCAEKYKQLGYSVKPNAVREESNG